jgi:hypothetical protein
MLSQILMGSVISIFNVAIHSLVMATVVNVVHSANEKKASYP